MGASLHPLKSIECEHYIGDGASFRLNSSQMLNICDACAYKLYKEIFAQVLFDAKIRLESMQSEISTKKKK